MATNDVSDELLKATISVSGGSLCGSIGVGLAIPATVNFAGLAVLLWAFAVSGLFLVRRAAVAN